MEFLVVWYLLDSQSLPTCTSKVFNIIVDRSCVLKDMIYLNQFSIQIITAFCTNTLLFNITWRRTVIPLKRSKLWTILYPYVTRVSKTDKLTQIDTIADYCTFVSASFIEILATMIDTAAVSRLLHVFTAVLIVIWWHIIYSLNKINQTH